MTRIRTLLIANRGEIAVRIIRTARSLGIRTVAVFSDADTDAPFVRLADEAVRLPGVKPADTYLRGDLIIEAARRTGSDAIHPGYGFLSENAGFARAVAEAGIAFVGPSPETIETMGSKIRSKEIMKAAGVPVLPSATISGGESDDEIVSLADGIGYPVLVKASAGGGGRGMRIVHAASEVAEAVASARREAGSAFGDDTVFLERFVVAPRHVEVQIFGDTHGEIVHLFERDCSIQRRYQKIVEESPSPAVTPELRAELGAAAIAAGRAIGYVGAGTVEFVLDAGGAFNFLEVNTRLQVEHPVTESVTGLDLVALQLHVAEGSPLPKEVREARMSGAAIEVRLYAEDPAGGFLPTSGLLRELDIPDSVRVDSGFRSGNMVGIHYDSMLAKVIASGPTREHAVDALSNALKRTRIHGLTTNRELLIGILEDPEFRSGSTDTAYLERHTPAELIASVAASDRRQLLAAAALAIRARCRTLATVQTTITSGWRNVRSQPATVTLDDNGTQHVVGYVVGGAHASIEIDGVAFGEHILHGVEFDGDKILVTLEVDGIRSDYRVVTDGTTVDIDGSMASADLTIVDPLPEPATLASQGSLAAPMPGSVTRLEVAEGATVVEGQPIMVLEAMKMEHTIRAPQDGCLSRILVSVGDQVEIGQELAVVDVAEEAA